MKIKFKIFVLSILCICIVPPTSPAAATKIKLTTLAPRGSSYYKILKKMGDEWRKLSDGSIRLVIYPGGIQGGEAAMVDRMRINQSQAALLTAVGLSEIEPAVNGLQSFPVMFNNLDEVDYIGRGLHPRLEKRLEEKGFHVIFWVDVGWVRFFSRSPMITPADLKKMKLFTWVGNTRQVDIMQSAGFNPVPLETADIIPGLQTGLIDVVSMPPFYALARQVYLPAPNMLDLDWAPLIGAAVITKKAWDKIPVEFRDGLLSAASRAGEEIRAAGRRENSESVLTMEEKWGLKVHSVSPEIKEEWRMSMEKIYPEIRGTIVPADIFDEVVRLLKEYRDENIAPSAQRSKVP